MPTSSYGHIHTYVSFLDTIRPASILDIGLGNGKLGYIARDLLDVMIGQAFRREDWKVKIDGIEFYSDYVQDHQKAIYDDIFIGDAFDVIDTLGAYDLIVLGDVLEHFEKKQALEFLDKCISHTNSHIIICIPLGNGWVQGALYGKEKERHLSFWDYDEFKPFVSGCEFFEYTPGPYGAFLIKKEDYINHKVDILYTPKNNNHLNKDADLRKKFALSKENVSKIDLIRLSKHVGNDQHRFCFLNTDFKEHYRLIAYLGTLFNDTVIFDIGTNKGCSSLALSYNNTNRIISYDVVSCTELMYADELTKIEYLIGDARKDARLLNASLIMLDTFHDGVFEKALYGYLKKNNYKGLLFLDDIRLNQPMEAFWHSITEPKEDLTDLGHWSGSGIVDFSFGLGSVKEKKPPCETLYLGLKAGDNYGWGVCSRYLIKELSKKVNVSVLNESNESQKKQYVPGKLFHALTSVDFFSMFETHWGTENYGYTFFENELTKNSVENSKKYDLVLAGSTWCRDRMLEKQIHNCGVLIQGIDPNHFYPVTKKTDQNKFVIFSGGKFELRKGQDLVLRAVKVLQEKYADVFLVNCWYNIWPESIKLMKYSQHINFEYKDNCSWTDLMSHIYKINGLDQSRIETIELVPNEKQREIFKHTDIGVFPNRCEGGTNLAMMEYMACGKPVIASNTSGHKDIVTRENALLLNDLKNINLVDANGIMVGRWQEPSLDELVSSLEFAYHNRDQIKITGERAGQDLKKFTWEKSAKQLLNILSL